MTSSIKEDNSILKFALDFYGKVVQLKQYRHKNVLFSPVSICATFALVLEGARGQTAKEIRSVFGFSDEDKSIRALFSELYKELNHTQGAFTLNIANALWIEQGYPLSDAFAEIARESYSSEVANVDMMSKETVALINRWIESNTGGKIRNIIPEGSLDRLTRLIITNAIYFRGFWEIPFNAEDTRVGDFHTNTGTVKTSMMTLRAKCFNYVEHDLFQIIELPYKGNKISMLILLPKSKDGLTRIEKALSTETLNSWTSAPRNTLVNVHIPRFNLEADYDLRAILSEFGMQSAFAPDSADLTGITVREKINIQAALHKAILETDEEGTTAAAVTSVLLIGGSSRRPTIPTFRADHPFIFIIQDSETGNILFMGRVTNPAT